METRRKKEMLVDESGVIECQALPTEIIMIESEPQGQIKDELLEPKCEPSLQQKMYSCSCGQSFEVFLELAKHESQKHSVEFKKILTELKNIIIEFMRSYQNTVASNGQTSPEIKFEHNKSNIVNQPIHSLKLKSTAVVKKELKPPSERAVIKRLQGLGVSVKLKSLNGNPKHALTAVQAKQDNKPSITLKKLQANSSLKEPSIKRPRPLPPKPAREQYSCKRCQISLKTPHQLQQHNHEHHPYICETCGNKYNKKLNLEFHMLRVHKNVQTRCQKCNRNFIDLEEHIKTHEFDPEFICDYCGLNIKGKQKLTRHIQQRHRISSEELACDVCNKNFQKKYDLLRHKIKHDPNPETHKCKVCDKEFLWRNCMLRHLKAHTENHPCPMCSKIYARSDGLKYHMSKHHSGVRPPSNGQLKE